VAITHDVSARERQADARETQPRRNQMFVKMAALTALAFALLVGGASAATIKVTTTNDELNEDGDCSLREAVTGANTNGAIDDCEKGQGQNRDVIKLKAAEYGLITGATGENLNAGGDLDITGGGPVTVEGKGSAATLVIDDTDDDRVFDIPSSAGNLTLDAMNVASGDVAADFARGGNIRVVGGKVAIRNSDVSGGDAYIGGGVSGEQNARINISRSLFETNDATGSGGALALSDDARATVKRTTLQQSQVESSTESIEGGIISAAGDKLTVLDSTLQGSGVSASGAAHAAFGGGIWANSDVVVKRSLIQGIDTRAEEDNVGEHGGGIFLQGGNLDVVNSTFFNTSAGFGLDNDGSGGAVFVAGGAAELSHVTIDATDATSVGDAFGGTSGSLLVRQSVVEDAPDPCSGTPVFSGGFNVTEDDDADCDFIGSDAPNVVTGLGSVSDNGGPTLTIPISPTSLAKNFVPKAPCKQHTKFEDQRKFQRPKGKKCDAGAFELGATKK
jgi:CSLREA domain-containing protein